MQPRLIDKIIFSLFSITLKLSRMMLLTAQSMTEIKDYLITNS
jgi:hypothetical protein